MLLISYPKKVLLKIPENSFDFSIINDKFGLKLVYKIKGVTKPKQEDFVLDSHFFYDISEKSVISQINVNKIEIYRIK